MKVVAEETWVRSGTETTLVVANTIQLFQTSCASSLTNASFSH